MLRTMGISRRKQTTLPFLVIIFSLPSISLLQPKETHGMENDTKIGLILDMGSWSGKTIQVCIQLAISDFYSVNSDYETRIVLHSKDSKGESQRALSAVHHLLNNIKVQAIIVPEKSLEGKLLALFADKAKVPFFSFTGISPSSVVHPYLFQIKQDEVVLFKGIAALVESYKLMNVVIVYEDTDYGRETMPYLMDCLQEKNALIAYSSVISPSASDDQILHEVDKVVHVATNIIIMLMSSSAASRILLNVKKLRMVDEDFTWIITGNDMDLLHSTDHSEAINSMERAVLKPYIPASQELHTFTSRWKKEFDRNYPASEAREMSVLGIWAYDAVWAIAECFERVRNRTAFVDWEEEIVGVSPELGNIGVSLTSEMLVNEISQIRLKGLSGQFRITSGKLVSEALELVKLRGSKERRVGLFWTLKDGIVKQTHEGHHKETFHQGDSITAPIQDRELIIAVPVKSTFKELVNVEIDSETNETTISGYCIDVFEYSMNAASASNEVKARYKFVPFVEPEGESSGSYNELLYRVSRQEYDGGVADITILANRSKWVDFTVSYTDLGIGTISRIDNSDKWIFTKPFGVYVWLTIVVSFIFMGFLVWLFEHPTNEAFQGSTAQQVVTMLWFTFMTLFFAQRERLTSNWSRFIVIVWLFMVLILISCYTAILSSLLTVQQIQLASTGNTIGYRGGSFVQGVIIDNMNFLDYRLQPYKTPKEFADALSKGSKNGGVDAIVDEIPYLKIFLAQYSAGYAMVSSKPSTSGFGFAFQKGSPLVHYVSRGIAKLREDGTLALLEKKWFKSSSSSTLTEAANEPKILALGDLSGLFIIGATAFGLALLMYLYNFFNDRFHLKEHIFIILARGRLAIMIRYLYLRNLIWATA